MVCINFCDDNGVGKLTTTRLDWLMTVYCVRVYEFHIQGDGYPFT